MKRLLATTKKVKPRDNEISTTTRDIILSIFTEEAESDKL